MFLNSESLELLEALGVEIEEFEELKFGLINDMDGNVLFSGGNYLGEYGVYKNKEMIFRGVLAEDYDGVAKIWSGYEKSKEYVGNYSEGKFHGEGCEYDWHGEKYREGIFCKGELEKGTEYNWIVKYDGEDYEKYIQAGKQLNPTMLFDAELEYEGWDKFFVADFEVDGDTERMINLRPLKNWMDKM